VVTLGITSTAGACDAPSSACPVADAGDRVGPTPSDSQHELTAFEHFAPPVAQNKVANNPRLNAVCTRIVDQLGEHYAMPTSPGVRRRRRRPEPAQRDPAAGRPRPGPQQNGAYLGELVRRGTIEDEFADKCLDLMWAAMTGGRVRD